MPNHSVVRRFLVRAVQAALPAIFPRFLRLSFAIPNGDTSAESASESTVTLTIAICLRNANGNIQNQQAIGTDFGMNFKMCHAEFSSARLVSNIVEPNEPRPLERAFSGEDCNLID